jgi:2-methylisocitrate lyase-like PEP mutase family enzyme
MPNDAIRLLAARADALRALHQRGRPVVLPNAWDVASAKRFAKLGFAAIATTSAGVANALGWADGEAIPPDEMFAAVGRIAAAVDVPVTADLEAGYGLAADELVARLLASAGSPPWPPPSRTPSASRPSSRQGGARASTSS